MNFLLHREPSIKEIKQWHEASKCFCIAPQFSLTPGDNLIKLAAKTTLKGKRRLIVIISRTPFRISFFGGGTDYPAWVRENGGAVLATTIDKYCYISIRYLPPFFDHTHRVVYSKIETVKNIEEIVHPAVKAILGYFNVKDGLEIHHDGDLPARSGLGSSSSFSVGMINGLKAMSGEFISKQDLAKTAIHIEQNVIKETVGSQDQIAASFGGLNRIDFQKDQSFQVSPIIISQKRKQDLQDHCMLFFTGLTRFATEVAQTKVNNFSKKESELRSMRAMVDEAASILQSPNSDLGSFGRLLNESWLLKRSLSDSVSTPEIDEIYSAGKSAGALGGKLLGAGGGGFMLFFVPPENQAKLRERLKKLVYVSTKFESEGSKIVFYDPQVSDKQETGVRVRAGVQKEAFANL